MEKFKYDWQCKWRLLLHILAVILFNLAPISSPAHERCRDCTGMQMNCNTQLQAIPVISYSSLVCSIVRFGIFIGRCNSFIGKMLCVCDCILDGWQPDEFVSKKTDLYNPSWVANNEWYETQLMSDIIAVHCNKSHVIFPDSNSFMTSELNSIMLHMATNCKWFVVKLLYCIVCLMSLSHTVQRVWFYTK